jgi:hypothetical protein
MAKGQLAYQEAAENVHALVCLKYGLPARSQALHAREYHAGHP